MALLPNNKRYIRPQPSQEAETNMLGCATLTITQTLEIEESCLLGAIQEILEAKSREHSLRERLNVVRQSLQAFRALEAAPEPVQETPVPVVKNVRKAATKKAVTPTQRSIAPEPTVSDTENINLVHDDFAAFPE